MMEFDTFANASLKGSLVSRQLSILFNDFPTAGNVNSSVKQTAAFCQRQKKRLNTDDRSAGSKMITSVMDAEAINNLCPLGGVTL